MLLAVNFFFVLCLSRQMNWTINCVIHAYCCGSRHLAHVQFGHLAYRWVHLVYGSWFGVAAKGSNLLASCISKHRGGLPSCKFVFPNVCIGVEYFVPCFFQYLVFVQWFVQVWGPVAQPDSGAQGYLWCHDLCSRQCWLGLWGELTSPSSFPRVYEGVGFRVFQCP